ncbi:helix-turn-helix domain-containing protein [Orbaceae bacterium ac157xtp]
MQTIHQQLRSKSYSVPCELCNFGSLCIPKLLDNSLDSILNRKVAFNKNETVIKQGDKLSKFYIVHSGTLKSYIEHNGIQQINGFYLPGDIVGLDAINTKTHNNSVTVLTSNTLVCELNYNELMVLISKNHEVRDLILNLLSETIADYQKLILCYSQKRADEKLASFIYSYYCRYAKRGHVSHNIKLTMSRLDIANYLGLTIETVSRILTRLQELAILTVHGRYIHIADISALIELAGENSKVTPSQNPKGNNKINVRSTL